MNPVQRIALLEQQVNLLTSMNLALALLVEEKMNISHEDLAQRINKIHAARNAGMSHEDFKKHEDLAGKLTIVRNAPINLNNHKGG